MSLVYTVNFADVASSATQNTFKTIIALRALDTLGHRFRLLKVSIASVDDTAQDEQFDLQIKRVDDVSGGNAGTYASAPTPRKVDPASRASVITCGVDCISSGGAEPSVYGDPLYAGPFNLRNTLIEPFIIEERYEAHRDMILGILLAPRAGNNARQFSGMLTYEEF